MAADRTLTIAKHWYSVTWVDWLTVAGLGLTLVGIYLTWRQAHEAKTAAQAAQAAVSRTQRQLRANQLLVLVPQLRWISSELEASITDSDPLLTGRNLHNWRWAAGNVHGILSAAEPAEKRLLKSLQDSIGQAFAATTILLDPENKDRPVLDSCRTARDAIGVVCNELTSWVGQASTSNGTEEVLM